jgi:hypothetical protein
MRKKLNLTTVSNEELKNSKAGALHVVDPISAIGMLEPYQCYFHCHCGCWDWGLEEQNSSLSFTAGNSASRNYAAK